VVAGSVPAPGSGFRFVEIVWETDVAAEDE
jgi:hypothetical protein